MDGNPQSLRLEGKPSDARSNARVAIVALPALFISVGIFRQPTAERREPLNSRDVTRVWVGQSRPQLALLAYRLLELPSSRDA